jgi:hypothetical protein
MLSLSDIGCHHGLLSIELSSVPSIDKVYAMDCSIDSLEETRRNIDRLPTSHLARLKVEPFLSNGANHLLKQGDTSNIIVMCGMGAQSMFDILINKVDFNGSVPSGDNIWPPSNALDQYTQRSKAITNQLQSKLLVLQPSPPKLLDLLHLHRFCLLSGWNIYDQRINQSGKYSYITTSFNRVSQPIANFDVNNPQQLLAEFPLIKSLTAGTLDIQKSVWMVSYLKSQRRYFSTKLRFVPSDTLIRQTNYDSCNIDRFDCFRDNHSSLLLYDQICNILNQAPTYFASQSFYIPLVTT